MPVERSGNAAASASSAQMAALVPRLRGLKWDRTRQLVILNVETHTMKTDFFLKIDGIKGESADSQHTGEIDVETFSWGESNTTTLASPATGSGAGAGKVRFDSLFIITRVSSASPQLAVMVASGKHAMTAVLTARKAGGKQEEYYKVTFKTVFVSQYRSVAVTGTDLIPRDEITLAFGEYVIEYRPQNKDGTLGSPIMNGWNQISNTKA
jgi:type VI secretion system secreted protein Hcp